MKKFTIQAASITLMIIVVFISPQKINAQPITTATSNCAVTKVGNPQFPPSIPPSCNTSNVTAKCTGPAPTDYSSAQQALQSKFKIVLSGITDQGWAIETYNTVCVLAQSDKFFGRLTAQGPISVTLHTGGCGYGHASAATGVDLYGICDKNYNRFILTHELGHMFAFRNPSVYNAYLSQVWTTTIPTWDCLLHFGDGVTAPECFADLVGEYVSWSFLRETVSGQPAGSQPFSDYPTGYINPTTHVSYYSFGHDQIFGGVEYKSF